jgi:hypothetical protein
METTQTQTEQPQKETTNGAFKFMKPEEIDQIMRNCLNANVKKGGKNCRKAPVWKEADIALRDSVIYDLLGQGLSKRRVAEEISSRWGCGYSTAYVYIQDALARLAEKTKPFVQYCKEEMIERLNAVAEDALAHNDRKSALKAYDEINKLNGLYEEKIDANIKGETEIKFKFGGDE